MTTNSGDKTQPCKCGKRHLKNFSIVLFQVQVDVTLSHDEQVSLVHSPAAMWVESVSTTGFRVCARESGIGNNGSGIINWLAFQDQPHLTHGSLSLSGIWTTETKCDQVIFSQVGRNDLLQVLIMTHL